MHQPELVSRSANQHRRRSTVVTRIALTLLTLAVLLPSTAFAGVRYLCAIDGQARKTCCCPAKTHPTRRTAPPTEMRRSCCCKISTTVATITDARHETAETPYAASPPVIVPAPAFAMLAITSAIPTRWIAPRPPTPDRDLVVHHCSLLL